MSLRKRFNNLLSDEELIEFCINERREKEIDKFDKIKNYKKQKRLKRERQNLKYMEKNYKNELDNMIDEHLMNEMIPQTPKEKYLMEKMIKELGTLTTVPRLSKFLNYNDTNLYIAIDNGEILTFRKGKRIFVITEGVLPFLRD